MCPPAAFAIGFGFGVLEVGSVIAGRDYLSGRKMDTGERIQRGIFGALDMLPGVVVIAKQFEYGRKILNTVGKLKAKSLNFVKDTYDIGKSKLTSAYNSLITKIDDFESSIIRQIDDAFVGNSRLRPAFAGIPSNYADDLVRNSEDLLELNRLNNIDDIAEADYTNFTFEDWLSNMSKEEADRYISWHDYGDNHLISYEERIKVLNWEYTTDVDLYIKYRYEYNNAIWYDQLTGKELYPPNNGFVEGTEKIVKLKKGTIIDRYGDNSGSFLGNIEDDISARSLSIRARFNERHVFEILEDTKFKTGEIAPWFGEKDGGTQYIIERVARHEKQKLWTVQEMIMKGILREIK